MSLEGYISEMNWDTAEARVQAWIESVTRWYCVYCGKPVTCPNKLPQLGKCCGEVGHVVPHELGESHESGI